jgi:hypothetical protein
MSKIPPALQYLLVLAGVIALVIWMLNTVKVNP